MNRNILLFVCICLTASFLTVRFHHRQAANGAVALRSAITKPADGLPIFTAPTVEPIAETVVVQNVHDSNTVAGSEAVIADPTNISVVEGKNIAEDKFELLRQLSRWAAKDPQAALAAALALPAGDERNEALRAVCSGLAQTDPAEAVKLALELHLDKQPTAIMQDLVQQWAESDLISSLAWAEDQAPGSARDEFTTRVAFVMSQSDPSDAADLVMKQIPPGPAQDEAIMTVLNQWANQNFVAAAGWAKGAIVGPLQERVFSELKGIIDYQHALAGR